MTVYVDDFSGRFRGMIMCHMAADTTLELHRMADRLGLVRHWIQHGGTWKEHYDISQARRRLAVYYGAQEVTGRQLVVMMRKRQKEVLDEG